MKAIVKTQTKVEGNKITITGEIVDVTQPIFMGQRTTVQHPVNGQLHHPRHIQVNTHGTMVMRNKSDGVLFPKDEMAAIAIEVDRTLTSPPVFVKHPSQSDLVGRILSEIPLEARIESSDDRGKTWKEVPKDHKPENGRAYRCVAKNACGETASQILVMPKQPEPPKEPQK